MTRKNWMLLFGWLGLLLATMLLAAFVSAWFLFGTGIVLLTASRLPQDALKVLSSGGLSLLSEEKKNK